MKTKQNGWSKHVGLRFQIGLIISLGITLVAFEWKTYGPQEIIDLGSLEPAPIDTMITQITEQKPPEPPKSKLQPKIIETETEEDLADIEITFEVEDIDDLLPPEPEIGEDFEEEEVEEAPVVIAEVSAQPQEGMPAFLQFIAQNIHYPKQAKRTGVEGKVFVQFIVEKDGTLSDIRAVRGIGAGCDEEALRVIKLSKPWVPARQRGVPVRQRLIIPIHFRLQ